MKTKKSIIVHSIIAIVLSTISLCICNNQVLSSGAVNTALKERLSYKDYQNIRYEFSIKYPDNLVIGQESDNGDGITLTDESNSTKLIVFGSNNIFGVTAKSAYNASLMNLPKVSYKKQSGNWYVISWIKNDKIIYKKEVVGNGSINTFIFEYPLSQKKIYDEYLKNLNSYFKTPGIGEAH